MYILKMFKTKKLGIKTKIKGFNNTSVKKTVKWKYFYKIISTVVLNKNSTLKSYLLYLKKKYESKTKLKLPNQERKQNSFFLSIV